MSGGPKDELERLRARCAALEAEVADLRSSDAQPRHDAFLNAIDEGMCVIEFTDGPGGPLDDYRHVEANTAFYTHSGLAAAENRTVRDLLPDEAERWIPIYRRVLETGDPARFTQGLDATGRVLEVSAYRMEPASRGQVVILSRDATDRLRTERELVRLTAHLDALVRSSSEVRYAINADWSELAELSGGGFLSDTASGNPNWLDEYIPQDHRDLVRAEIQRAVATGETYHIEHMVNRADGTVGWALSRAVPLKDEKGQVTSWMGAASDITFRKTAEAAQWVLNQELAHRMKNMLAMVQAVATQTLRQARTMDEGRVAIAARLQALARAQDILTQTNFAEADIRDVVRATVNPHDDQDGRVSVQGPRLALNSQQALGLSLAIHELATNAAKYGALSNETGTVAMSWGRSNGSFFFTWNEAGGPTVTTPTRRGFGSRLIERIVASYFDGEARIEFDPAGIRYRLTGAPSDVSVAT